MIIDFKEIPQSNIGGDEQDRFEQFACDFLDDVGFKIIIRPSRGADGKMDMKVREQRTGNSGEITTVDWLVSCKHHAHSGKNVSDTHEPNIQERLTRHSCQGFIGFYSTNENTSLIGILEGLKQKQIEYLIFNREKIEKKIMQSLQKDRLLVSYFPLSYEKYRKISPPNNNATANTTKNLTESDVFRITKTAIILLEIEKIKEEYYNSKWINKENVLNKFFRYADHKNEKIASALFDFLNTIAYDVIGGRTKKIVADIVMTIESLIITFFPSSDGDTEKAEKIKNGIKCIDIGFCLVYQSIRHYNNLQTATYGLLILKFMYQEGKREIQIPELTEKVLSCYNTFNDIVSNKEYKNLVDAKKLVIVFKNDLETNSLMLPDLPDNLYYIIFQNDNE